MYMKYWKKDCKIMVVEIHYLLLRFSNETMVVDGKLPEETIFIAGSYGTCKC